MNNYEKYLSEQMLDQEFRVQYAFAREKAKLEILDKLLIKFQAHTEEVYPDTKKGDLANIFISTTHANMEVQVLTELKNLNTVLYAELTPYRQIT